MARWRRGAAVIGGALALQGAPADAKAPPPVRALHGAGACLALDDEKGCSPARGFADPNGTNQSALSADGRSLYIVSDNANAIGIIRVNPRSGRLSQDPGAAGCLAEHEHDRVSTGCARARGFAGVTTGVAVSPDDHFVYVSSRTYDSSDVRRGAVAVFARNADGTLQQLPGAGGCVTDNAFDACTVVPTLSGSDLTLDAEGLRAYVGGFSLTVLTRDPASGTLTYVGCESAEDDLHPGCAPTPLGVNLWSPVWVGDVGYANAFGRLYGVMALRIAANGLLEKLPGTGGCRSSGAPDRQCPDDGRLTGSLLGIIPTGDGELIGFSSAEGEFPAPRDTPFQLWTVRLGAHGAMSVRGAHCLSTTRHRRCARGDRLLGGNAIAANARRIYVAGERGVTAVARNPATGALRILGRVGKLRNPLIYGPTGAVLAPDGRFVYVIASSFYGTGSVKAYAVTG